MSVMDKLKNMLKGHEDKAGKGIDRGGDYADDKTRGKYTGQVDTAQDRARERFGSDPDQDPPTRT
jgi:hypothetical protein